MIKYLKIPTDILKERLIYDPNSGVFTWREHKTSRTDIFGKKAGYVNNMGYVAIGLKRVEYLAHRLAWDYCYGDLSTKIEVDHIDGDTENNRILNLRLADRPRQKWNIKTPINNRSGVIGVWWATQKGKWVSQIRVEGKRIHVGEFFDLKEAAKARRAAELKYHEGRTRSLAA